MNIFKLHCSAQFCVSLAYALLVIILKRFVSRQGCPSDIYSDSGRNFVHVSAYLKISKQIGPGRHNPKLSNHLIYQ